MISNVSSDSERFNKNVIMIFRLTRMVDAVGVWNDARLQISTISCLFRYFNSLMFISCTFNESKNWTLTRLH